MAILRRVPRARRRRARLFSTAILVGALLVASCGDDGASDDASTPEDAVEQAQQKLERAQREVERAQSEFDDESAAFCGDSEALIAVLDRYGQILDDHEVTVGQVKSGASELTAAREAADATADSVLEAREELDDAEAEVAAAEAELEAAQAALDTGSSEKPRPTVTSATTEPLVPESVSDLVTSTEAELAETAGSIDDATPVADATVALQSATYAVEVAWLQLFAHAGCLDDQQQADAVQTVAAYTIALQNDLKSAGFYSGDVDGLYGPGTVEAVEQLQKDAGLPVTGLLDPASERALDAAVAEATGSALAGAATHTASIQGALKVLGYWDGPVDGVWSDALGDAIVKLQTDLGVEPTGIVDTATLRALERELADVQDAGDTTTTTAEPSTTSTPGA